ncbi:MAG: TIGR00730 family Rossman fold protein [Candidatus Eremiobacteraeota bacterium]|nr:TIGR00730 family Rossman fold protein [Candidatus Eremiobacteraeota bacterium]
MQSVCVFCGSNVGRNSAYAQAAQALGTELARRGVAIVYGGGHVGLMGILADAALGAGGKVIGVIPQALADREVAHHGLTELHIVQSMHERKAMMANLCEAFVALPGGYGTLEEFFEVVTWSQLGIHDRPVGLLNVEGFYDPLIAMIDSAVKETFISQYNRGLVRNARTIDDLLRSIGC